MFNVLLMFKCVKGVVSVVVLVNVCICYCFAIALCCRWSCCFCWCRRGVRGCCLCCCLQMLVAKLLLKFGNTFLKILREFCFVSCVIC